MMPPRDRDSSGRPRNARARDALGRPLRATSIDRGPAADEPPALPPRAALDEASRLIAAGRPFEAHEVLEAVWKASTGTERPLWRALAQLAVGITHARRGNPTGATALLQRAADNLRPFATEPPYAVDVLELIDWSTCAAADLALTEQPPALVRD